MRVPAVRLGNHFHAPEAPSLAAIVLSTSRSNLADLDIVLGSGLCFLSFQALPLLPFD